MIMDVIKQLEDKLKKGSELCIVKDAKRERIEILEDMYKYVSAPNFVIIFPLALKDFWKIVKASKLTKVQTVEALFAGCFIQYTDVEGEERISIKQKSSNYGKKEVL